MSLYEYVGNPHVHTCYSDGAAVHAEVAKAAAQAGLDFVITTDHNVWVSDIEGYYDNVLLLVGEELHSVQCDPQSNHLLAFNAETELAPVAPDAQTRIDEVNQRAGFCFLAHPFERNCPIDPELEAIAWEDWDVEGYSGIELWNHMSEFKGLLRNRLAAIFYAYFPGLGIRGPYRNTLQQWDELLADGRRVAVIGAADAHGKTHSLGPLTRQVLPYEYLFRCVNTYVLTDLPLNGDLGRDKKLIYDGLRSGTSWIGYDLPASTSGFRFTARSGANNAVVGAELIRTGAVVFEIHTPRTADIRLLRHGNVVARTKGTALSYTSAVAGAYRVEAYLRYRLARRGWIFSNPIYVR